MAEIHELTAGRMRARISEIGAELQSLDLDGWNLLWTPDESVWPETAPLLFPVVGRTSDDRIRVEGKTFPMPMHGFARVSTFRTIAKSKESCMLELQADDETMKHYPFRFLLRVTYALSENGLSITVEIANPDPVTLPFSLGLHPGFRWPLREGHAKDRHVVVFGDDETLDYARPVNRQIGVERYRLPLDNGVLRLDEALFAQSGLAVLAYRSRSLCYQTEDGTAGIELDFSDMPQLILWMKPGSDFLCIEPCLGYADPVGFAGDFAQKPGMALVPAGGSKRLTIRMTPWLR